MIIDELYEDFQSKIADINHFQSIVRDETQKNIVYLDGLLNKENEDGNTDLIGRVGASNYVDLKTGGLVKYGFKKSKTKDLLRLAWLNKNQQYRWLLVEAYEEFNLFIGNLYAYMGHMHNAYWSGEKIDDFSQMSIDKFIDYAKNKTDTPRSILNKIRTIYPDLQLIESKNKTRHDLKFVICLIEHLRHIIVHNGGCVNNKENFLNRILEKIGRVNNGRVNQDYVGLTNTFFGTGDYENEILLVEILANDYLPIPSYHHPYSVLVGYLVSYASLLADLVSNDPVLMPKFTRNY